MSIKKYIDEDGFKIYDDIQKKRIFDINQKFSCIDITDICLANSYIESCNYLYNIKIGPVAILYGNFKTINNLENGGYIEIELPFSSNKSIDFLIPYTRSGNGYENMISCEIQNNLLIILLKRDQYSINLYFQTIYKI